MLNLTKPIVFFDLETTGINISKDRIVEMSFLKIHSDKTEEKWTQKINPEMPIPPESTEIHGINDEDVKNEPSFKEVAGDLNKFIDNSDLAGYNSNKFDVPFLVEEFLRAGIEFEVEGRRLIDVQNIFHKMEQRTLAAAYRFYCDKNLENAHSAEADNIATYEVLKAQLDKYENLENDMDYLHKFSQRQNNADLMGRIVFDKNNVEVFNFGKYKGKPVEKTLNQNPSYYDWMMKGDFPESTKRVLTRIKLRAFNK